METKIKNTFLADAHEHFIKAKTALAKKELWDCLQGEEPDEELFEFLENLIQKLEEKDKQLNFKYEQKSRTKSKR